MSKTKIVREKIWARLKDVALPDSRFHLNFAEVIPDFVGSADATDRLVAEPFYSKGNYAFITPDNCLVDLRRRMLLAGKSMVVSTYGIYRGFRLLEPAMVPPGQEHFAAWLDGLEAEIAGLAVAIAAARNDTVARLNDFMAGSADDAFPTDAFPLAGLRIDGAVETWLKEMPALAAEDRLRDCLRAARPEDAASGTTRWGTHRSDLTVTYLGRALGGAELMAADCSTGEQKALLLSIILAQARLTRYLRGQAPILLLDEAMAHLDGNRRRALFNVLLDLGAQAWLTGTERDWFKPLATAAQSFVVADGKVTEEIL